MTTLPPPGDPAWARIRARYEDGEELVRDIAAEIGLSQMALSLYAMKEKWNLRGKSKAKAALAASSKIRKPESTRATIQRLKAILHERVAQIEREMQAIGREVDELQNQKSIGAVGVLVRTIEKVLDLERKDQLKRKKAIRDFKYFDDEQRRQLAEKIERLETEEQGDVALAGAGAAGSGGAEQPVALLGEAGPAASAGS